jgi:hypothetical protein
MHKSARLLVLTVLMALLAVPFLPALGLTFSYFVPRGGWFSSPVSPLNLRDVGWTFGRYFGLAGSLSLYRFAGMGITDADGRPLDTGGPVAGPFVSVLGSVMGKVIVPLGNFEIVGQGGLFGCYNIDPPLMIGRLESYLKSTEPGAEAVSASLSSGGQWGWGYLFGGSLTYYLEGQLGLSLGALYYLGGADLGLSGSYTTYDGGSTYHPLLPASLREARLDFSGLEILAGVVLRL